MKYDFKKKLWLYDFYYVSIGVQKHRNSNKINAHLIEHERHAHDIEEYLLV